MYVHVRVCSCTLYNRGILYLLATIHYSMYIQQKHVHMYMYYMYVPRSLLCSFLSSFVAPSLNHSNPPLSLSLSLSPPLSPFLSLSLYFLSIPPLSLPPSLYHQPTNIRCKSDEGEHSNIVRYTNDKDEPESEGEVLDVLEANLFPCPVLLPLQESLSSPVKETKKDGTQQREKTERKACRKVKQIKNSR